MKGKARLAQIQMYLWAWPLETIGWRDTDCGSLNISMVFNILWHFNDLLWDIMQAKALIYSAVIWFYPKENESGSRRPRLNNGLHFRASQPDANFGHLHGARNYRSYHGIHGSSIFRETIRKHWPATDYSDVMKPCASNYSALPWSGNIQQSYHSELPMLAWDGRKWPWMSFQEHHQKLVGRVKI